MWDNSDGQSSSTALCAIRWCFVTTSQFNSFLCQFYFLKEQVFLSRELPQKYSAANLRFTAISQGIPFRLRGHGECLFRLTHVFSIWPPKNLFLCLGSISFCLISFKSLWAESVEWTSSFCFVLKDNFNEYGTGHFLSCSSLKIFYYFLISFAAMANLAVKRPVTYLKVVCLFSWSTFRSFFCLWFIVSP